MANKERRDMRKRSGGRQGGIGTKRGVRWEGWIGMNGGVARNGGEGGIARN